jgi:hypothetical protein
MTFAEKAALQEAVSRVEALVKVIERLNERVTAIEARQSAETEWRMASKPEINSAARAQMGAHRR